MDSSSNDSFAWSRVSDNSEDSDLDSMGSQPEKPFLNGDNDKISSSKKTPKRKLKFESPDSESSLESPKKKKIKVEETEEYTGKKKKKKKHKHDDSDTVNYSEENALEDYDYLTMKVKQEQDDYEKASAFKTKKNKKNENDTSEKVNKHSSFKTDDDKSDSTPKKQRNKKKHETVDESDNFIIEDKFSAGETEVQNISATSTFFDNDEPAVSTKKQRSKKIPDESDKLITENKLCFEDTEIHNDKPSPKKQRSKKKHKITASESDNDNFIIEDKFSAEETEVQKIPTKSMSGGTEVIDKRVTGDEVEPTNNIDTFENSIALKEKKVKKISNSTDEHSSTNLNNKQLIATPRILDRIRFEDESDSDTDRTKKMTNKQNDTNKESAGLNTFLKGKTHLKPVQGKIQKYQEITDNDELWILKCPQELDVTDFLNRDLVLESKSKVKLNGGTYTGSLDDDISRVTVMTAGNDKFIVKNVPVNGVVTLRKRLPKPHLLEDNVMTNQTDFIPLPDTKCRHPLFGSNYKRSLKLPSPVVERLNNGHTSTLEVSDKKKKKKQNKLLNGDLDAEIDVKPKIEVNYVIKKAKKRKHDDDSEKSTKKAKRIKQEPDSSDVWESEKAIEENLFNF